MDGPMLRLDLSDHGITAWVEDRGGSALGQEPVSILFEDLPEPLETPRDLEQTTDPFDRAMEIMGSRLDLSPCSRAVIEVPSVWVSFRAADLPFTSPKKIRQVLEFELEPLLPISHEAYISDFLPLKSKPGAGPLLTASIAESRIEQICDCLTGYGIKPHLIIPKGYTAAVRMLPGLDPDKNHALLFVTKQEVIMILACSGVPCAVRSFRGAGVSFESICFKLKQTIMGFNQQRGTKLFFNILVCSQRSTAQEDLNACESVFDARAVAAAENFDGLTLPEMALLRKQKLLFNFCQGIYGATSPIKKHLSAIITTTVLLVLVFGFFMAGTAMDSARLSDRIAAIDARAMEIYRQSFPKQKTIQDPYLQMKANVKAALKQSSANGKDSSDTVAFKTVEIINSLSTAIDSSIDVDISRFLYNSGKIVLSGSTDNFNNVNNIKSKIEAVPMFKTVEISSAAADKKDKQENRVNFKFIIEM